VLADVASASAGGGGADGELDRLFTAGRDAA
jgi:hypothetical protein